MVDRSDPPRGSASDTELLERWRAGDRGAGDVLIVRYYRDVRRLVARKLDDDPAVDDVVQEVFITVVRKRDLLDSGFRPYVFWVAKLALLEHYRARDRARDRAPDRARDRARDRAPDRSRGEALGRDSQLRGASGRFSSRLNRAHEFDVAIQAYAQLDVEEQCLLARKHFDDHTQQELAALHGQNEAQMAGRLKRARDRWRAKYAALRAGGAPRAGDLQDLERWLESMYGHELDLASGRRP